jgi:two-component system sensor histidine kinase DesK
VAVVIHLPSRPDGLPCAPQYPTKPRGVLVLPRTDRLLAVAPVAATVLIVAVQWSAAFKTGSALVAGILLVGFLPPHLHHVWSAAHGRMPRAGRWTLAAMAAVFVVGLVVVGVAWYLTAAQLLASVLIVLRPPWSIAAGVAVVVSTALVDQLVLPAPAPVWLGLVIVERAGATLVPAWFAGALRQLRAARAEMADRAVATERSRIDEQLAGTVGAELRAIAARGDSLAAQDPETAGRELQDLVDGSRRTLADARRIIRSFQRVPLRTELTTAVALLEAAGVHTKLTLPRGELGESEELALALRAAVNEVLHDRSVRACAITVTRDAGRLGLVMTADGASIVATEVAA